MMIEEYCSYILSRERNQEDFTIPGSDITINKIELITNMRNYIRGNGYRSYDSLLISTLRCYVSKEHLAKNNKFDESMDAILNNVKNRVERLIVLNSGMKRDLPFSYERVFEILVYYLRLITNILKSDNEKNARYVTAEISSEAIAYILNRKLSINRLDEEWSKNGWSAFYRDLKPLVTDTIDCYLKFILLSTYIRYCEIREIQ